MRFIKIFIVFICCLPQCMLAQAYKPMQLQAMHEKVAEFANSDGLKLKVEISNHFEDYTSNYDQHMWVRGSGFNKIVTLTYTFSKPVKFFQFYVSHVNNDVSGYENLKFVSVTDSLGKDITSSVKYLWTRGVSSGNPDSDPYGTIFNYTTKILEAKKGLCCEKAAGLMRIDHDKGFKSFVLQYELISGRPNGIYIHTDLEFDYKSRLVKIEDLKLLAEQRNEKKKVEVKNKKEEKVKVVKKVNVSAYESRIKAGKNLALHDIHFRKGLSEILPESFVQLDSLYEFLNSYKTVQIEVQGHTENIGDSTLNYTLSLHRANAVKDYLVQKGIVENRLSVKGLGGSVPIQENLPPEKNYLNRRVEIKIISR